MSSLDRSLYPTFICIGAQRAGTTWLHHCLKEHPEIFMPKRKELRFFSFNYEDGMESYLGNFADALDEKVRGEITPDYYHQEYALLRLKEDIPDVKLIFILRNPIDRAFSQYQLYCGTQYKTMSFEQTYKKHPDLIEWGMYGKHLEFILNNFLKKNVLVLEYDLLKKSPEDFLKQIFHFLEVDENFKPKNITRTYNKAIYPKLQWFLKMIGLKFIINLIKKSELGNWIRNRQKVKKVRISKKDFHFLASSFNEDVRKLGKLLNSDFTHWLKSLD